ncbi:putative FAD/NAD(P)-binding domain-containing protein [Seiridium cardinale]|uniref:FAD/NAD(P)-binding domain-containing protein n=1 Tax=Seiridium cardinale TaxID=138064 RepID=A0ABR2XE88_9PEZI
MSTFSETASDSVAFDVIIIGAGISGINCAYRIQTQLPELNYVVLEGRDRIGGTWDLFTYPGVRSDSTMFTLGFAWCPWSSERPIAQGRDILGYIEDAASKYHIRDRIRFLHRVSSADWSSDSQQWTLRVNHDSQRKSFTARWIVFSTGYYDYENPLQANIRDVINPQFWPKDYGYENKRVALIGSGATAVSLMPELAKKAAEVVMIQRSPTYVVAEENTSWAHHYLPLSLAMAYRRFHHTVFPYLFVLFCNYFPNAAREILRKETIKQLPRSVKQDPHFEPTYNPWEQRICSDPDAVFFKALGRSNVRLITGDIEQVTDTSIHIRKGGSVDADVIVTATGLNMEMGGSIDIRVDGEMKPWSKRLIWNGAMLDEIPNMMFMIGYTNNAWTLSADDTAFVLERLWKYMSRHGKRAATPRSPTHMAAKTERLWQLNATYVNVAESKLPVYGSEGNWISRTRPPFDYVHARWGNYTDDLQFS